MGLIPDTQIERIHLKLDAILVVTVILVLLFHVVAVDSELFGLLTLVPDAAANRAVRNGRGVVRVLLVLFENSVQLADDLHDGVDPPLHENAAERPRFVLVREDMGRGERHLERTRSDCVPHTAHKGADLEITKEEEFRETDVVLVEPLLLLR